MTRSVAVAVTAMMVLCLSTAAASTLTVNNFVSMADGTNFQLVRCTGPACDTGQFNLTPGTSGISITGPANATGTAPIEWVNFGGAIDTFLEFAVTSPVASVTGLSATVTGCGGNPSVPGCKGSNGNSSASASIITSTDSAATHVIGSNTVQFGAGSPNNHAVSFTQAFARQSALYIRMDLLADPNANPGAGLGYASFDAVTLALNAVPEPAALALLGSALAGLAWLRRPWHRGGRA